jgi:toxin ParE1/3/4
MKLVYSRRALADLNEIASYYAASTSPSIAEAIERRLGDVIDRICRTPEAAPRVSQRSHVRVVAVVRIPDILPGAQRHNRYFTHSTHVEAAFIAEQRKFLTAPQRTGSD